jgi:hypothetical protein
MRIHILALNGVFDTGLAAVLDAFGTANALAEMTGMSSLRFQMKVVGLRKSITTAHRLTVPVISATRAQTVNSLRRLTHFSRPILTHLETRFLDDFRGKSACF